MKTAQTTARFGVLLLTAAIIVLSGCGRDYGPTAPEMEEVITPLPMPPGMAVLGGETAVSDNIDSEGGVLHLEFCTLVIPEGALDGATVISVTRDDPDYATVEFGPDGQQFLRPVEMLFSIEIFEGYMAENGLAPEDLGAALFAEDMGAWVPLDARVKVIGMDHGSILPGTYISATTTHFSRYALID